MNTFILDIDGTLIDSPAMYVRGLQRMIRRHGKDYALADLSFSNGIPSKATMTRLGFTDPVANAAAIREWGETSQAFADLSDWFAGFPEVLTQLRQAGAKIGIVTSKNPTEFASDDQRYHFSDYIDTRVAAGDAAHDKPAPDPLLLAVQQLGETPAQAVYVGDTAVDAAAAHAAGIAFGLAGWTTSDPTPDFEPIAYQFTQPADLLKLL